MESQIEIVKAETLPIPDQAKMIVVRDQSSLEKANLFFLDIRALRKKISDVFDPIISKAHFAHKEALYQKGQTEAPLIEAEKYLNGQITIYAVEQEKKRREEEELARQTAIKTEMERRRQEEEERISQATALEEVGAYVEAEALITEMIEEIQKPLEINIAPPETQKVKLSGATVKEYWHAEVTDLRALCKAVGEGKQPLAYISANMTPLNNQARDLRKEMNIPGVKAVSTSNMAATGKR